MTWVLTKNLKLKYDIQTQIGNFSNPLEIKQFYSEPTKLTLTCIIANAEKFHLQYKGGQRFWVLRSRSTRRTRSSIAIDHRVRSATDPPNLLMKLTGTLSCDDNLFGWICSIKFPTFSMHLLRTVGKRSVRSFARWRRAPRILWLSGRPVIL